jgi:hypothetical protein
MLQHIIDSATGDTIGNVNIAGMDDEQILEWLHRNGYLMGSSDYYEISRGYPFSEGELVVIDLETNHPVLKLELVELKAA